MKQRFTKLAELDMPGLCLRRSQALRIAAIGVLNLATSLAIFGAKMIA